MKPTAAHTVSRLIIWGAITLFALVCLFVLTLLPDEHRTYLGSVVGFSFLLFITTFTESTSRGPIRFYLRLWLSAEYRQQWQLFDEHFKDVTDERLAQFDLPGEPPAGWEGSDDDEQPAEEQFCKQLLDFRQYADFSVWRTLVTPLIAVALVVGVAVYSATHSGS